MAVDHRAFEALLADPELQLIGRQLGSGNGQCSKGRKPLWILFHNIEDKIVRFTRDRGLLALADEVIE